MPKQVESDLTAAELTAFLVIECGVNISLSDIQELSLNDTLVQAMLEAWRVKQDREMERFALLASITANVMGGNKTKPTDFFQSMSVKRKLAERKSKENALRAMFMKHNARLEA